MSTVPPALWRSPKRPFDPLEYGQDRISIDPRHGRVEVLVPGSDDFESLRALFPEFTGLRSIIRLTCTRISDSCGWGVPLYEFQGARNQLTAWADKLGPGGIAEYVQEKNAVSLDGLPGI